MISHFSALLWIFLWSNGFGDESFRMKIVTRFDHLDYIFENSEILKTDRQTYVSNSDDKQSICRDIINTAYFTMKQEIFIDVKASSTKLALQKYNQKILKNTFEQTKIEWPKRNARIRGRMYKIEAYSCLTQNLRNQKFKEYFISRRVLGFSSVVYVFSYNHNQQLVPEVLVEEIPRDQIKIVKRTENPWDANASCEKQEIDVYTYYVHCKDILFHRVLIEGKFMSLSWYADSSRDTPSIAHKHYFDYVCKKWRPHSVKLRICASVMWKFIDDKEIQFWPTKFNVKYTCVKGDIIVGDEVRKHAPYPFVVTKTQDWLLGCIGYDLKKNKRITLYVSENSVGSRSSFVHEEVNGKFVPRVFYERVSPIYYSVSGSPYWNDLLPVAY